MMFRCFLLLLFVATTSFAQVGSTSETCIWSGTVANCLPADGIYLPNQRDARFGEATGGGTNYVALQAPAALGGDITLTLPPDDGDANEFLQTNGSGTMTWEPVDLTTDITGVLPLANGGTNGTDAAVNGGLVYSDADSMEITAAGTASQWVLSGGAGAPTMSNTTTTAKVIDGSADAVQLTVQGNAPAGAQTADIFVVEQSDNDELLQVTNTNGTQIFGTTTGGAACTGCVGEVIRIFRVASAAEGLATGTVENVGTTAALTLGPGKWQLCGALFYNIDSSATISQFRGGVSTVSATLSADADAQGVPNAAGEYTFRIREDPALLNANDDTITIPCYNFLTATGDDLYLVTSVTFGAGTVTVAGFLEATRLR